MRIIDIPINGFCKPEFQAVKKAFARNFSAHDELGAACCLYVGGEKVVDLWGGWADKAKTQAWQEDTLSGFYSVGKALVTICALHVCGQHSIDIDAPVTDVWPEYGEHGKDKTTLRHFLTHQAGMPAIRERLPDAALFDWHIMVDALAHQAPYWEPGTRQGYHTNTFGLLVGEFVRRISGLSIGEYLQKHIAGPLGAEVYIGLTDTDLTRCAELDWPQESAILASFHHDFGRELDEDARMRLHAYANPMGISSVGVLNSAAWRQAEIPSANGYGSASGVACVFNALANGGTQNGHHIVDESLLKEAYRLQCEGDDFMLNKDMRWGLGFQLTHPNRMLGPNANSFGHFGNGGSLGFADPDANIGFGYTLNRIVRSWGSQQNRALISAIYDCLP